MLNKQQILEYCQNQNLITGIPFEKLEQNIKSSSYDLQLGSEYYVYNEKDNKNVIVEDLGVNDSLCIPENGVCYIISEEKLTMPTNLSGDLSLALGLIKKGIMISRQPPVDPGYSGKIVAMLHNLSNKAVYLKRGQHILTIVFHEIKETNGYKGSYQDLDSLRSFVQEPIISALDFVSKEVKSTRERFEKFIPWILTTISIMLALASLFGLFNTGLGVYNNVVRTNVTQNSTLGIGNTLKIGNTGSSLIIINNKELIIELPHINKHILINIDTGDVQKI